MDRVVFNVADLPRLYLTPHDRRRVAVAAGVHDRTVAGLISGRQSKPSIRERVHDALRSLGFLADRQPVSPVA